MASAANASDALGIVGSLKMATDINENDLVVVMENPTVTTSGIYQSTRFHFSAIRLSGVVEYSWVQIPFHAASFRGVASYGRAGMGDARSLSAGPRAT